VTFQRADILASPFPSATFDHAFVCFVLEHVPRPVDALRTLLHAIKPGGTITVIEGGFREVRLSPRMVYVDSRRRHTFGRGRTSFATEGGGGIARMWHARTERGRDEPHSARARRSAQKKTLRAAIEPRAARGRT